MTDYSFEKFRFNSKVSIELVMLWILLHEDAFLDHTTFQGDKEWNYFMVSNSDDLGCEENVRLGLDKWEKYSGAEYIYDEKLRTYVIKANDTYYYATF